METFMDTLVGIGFIVIIVLILRAVGAWMLRIDEVISVQKEILAELRKNNPAPQENLENQQIN